MPACVVLTDEPFRRVLMLGTFGLRPKATLRARALAIAQTLSAQNWSFNLVTTPWDYPADAGKRWCEQGTPVINTRSTRPVAFPLTTLETTRHLRSLRPDLVHLFKPKGFGDLSARVFRHSLPIVVDLDDWEGDGGWNEIGGYNLLQRRVFNWQERTWPRQASAVTVASRELERRAVDLGASPNRVHYVPNGLTSTRFTMLAGGIRQAPDRDRRPPRILLYTRFVEFKPAFLVEVLAIVRRMIPETELLIAGASSDGRAENVLQLEAKRAGIQQAINRQGWIHPDALAPLAATCDLAIHPFDDNLVNRAKCSVKLLELMATGIPVITSRVGENASAIEDEISGRLTSPGDAPAMASVVVELLNRPRRAAELGKSAQLRIQNRYLWETLALRVATAYQQALVSPSPAH